jgi:hypothetical protein
MPNLKYKIKKQFRYQGYDYSQNGFYFVTICTKNREMFFGDIKNEKIKLSDIGLIANKFWLEIPSHFPFVVLDEYAIMPDHIHGIIKINNNPANVGTGHCPVLANNSANVGTGHCPVLPNNSVNAITGHCPVLANNPVNEITGQCPVLDIFPGKGFSVFLTRTGQCPVPTGDISGQCPVPTGEYPVVEKAKFGSVKSGSLSIIIGSYKSVVTKNVNRKISNYNFAWQSRFHDRIIRNDEELNRARQYIINNPLKWGLDKNN